MSNSNADGVPTIAGYALEVVDEVAQQFGVHPTAVEALKVRLGEHITDSISDLSHDTGLAVQRACKGYMAGGVLAESITLELEEVFGQYNCAQPLAIS